MDRPVEKLTAPMMEYCSELSTLFWDNIELLHGDTPTNPLESYLYDWAIVLGTLALDVFESAVLLLEHGKVRAANMVTRALADYNVRLRYYIVQSCAPRRGFEDHPEVDIDHFKAQMHAAKDWDNADVNLLGIVSRYDTADWPEDARDAIDRMISSGETAREMGFKTMLCYLEENEARERHVLPILQAGLERHYHAMIPNWQMQSAFLHGAQAVVTDVIEIAEGERTGRISRGSPFGTIRPVLFTAINHMIDLISSFAQLRGLVFGEVSLANKAALLWVSSSEVTQQ